MRRSTIGMGQIAATSSALVGLVLLAGCGGGGGGSPAPPPSATLVISAANSDTISHATASGLLAMSPAQTLPLAESDRTKALGWAGASAHSGWLGDVVAQLRDPARARTLAAGASRVKPLAVTGPIDTPCTVSGKFSTTFEDKNNDSLPSPGDVLTIAFYSCKDTEDETVDGTVVTTIASFDTTSGSFGAQMTMSALSDATSRHATIISGTMQLDYQMVSATSDVTRLTAVGRVGTSVSTHLPFTDTVTLMNGFYAELSYDSVGTPPGGGSPGFSTLTVGGLMDSTAAGGSVEVSTRSSAPLVQSDSEAYPRSGIVDILGKTGTVVVTVKSADTVRIGLDANDDGTPEGTHDESWDWLF
jgi:hypothetical protein